MSDRRRRVLVLTPDFPPTHGGIQLLVSKTIAGWDELQPTVVTLASDGDAAFDASQSFSIHRVRRRSMSRALEIAALNASAVAWGLRTKPDVVVCAHVVCSPAARALVLLLRVPVLQYLYAKEIDGRPRLARFAIRRADRVVAISAYTRDLALRLGGSSQRVEIIPPGVDVPGGSTAARAEQPTILTISRLRDSYKGHDVMLAALPKVRAAVPDVRWVVVGDGPLRPSLEAEAARSGLGGAVTFCGAVSDAERDAWLDRAWVFSMPSRTPKDSMSGEGFGIVYMEASAHGLPVLAGGVGGALDAVEDGVTGLLVDPTDLDAVADGLIRLLTDRAMAERMAANGRTRARGYAWPLVADAAQREVLRLAHVRADAGRISRRPC